MRKDKTIVKLDDELWQRFAGVCRRNGITITRTIEILIEEYLGNLAASEEKERGD